MQYTLHVHVRVRPRPSARLGTYKDIWSCAVRKGPPAASYSSLFALSSPSYNGRRIEVEWRNPGERTLGEETHAGKPKYRGGPGRAIRPAGGGRARRASYDRGLCVRTIVRVRTYIVRSRRRLRCSGPSPLSVGRGPSLRPIVHLRGGQNVEKTWVNRGGLARVRNRAAGRVTQRSIYLSP